MNKKLILPILAFTCLCCCGQRNTSTTDKISIDSELVVSTKNNKGQRSRSHELDKYIYTDTTYTFSSGKGITIQNSYPKGGMIEPDGTQYIDSTGNRYGFVVLWTRIINETTSPLALNINLPADSFAIFTPPGSYLKLFLPTDTLTYDKLSSFNYGLTGLQSYLDANFNKATTIQKTINPNEEHIFYIAALSYKAGGTVRSALILKEQELYYRMSIAPHGYGIIPFGKIAFQNEAGN